MANPNGTPENLKKSKKGDPPNKGAGRPKGATGIAADIKRCIRALQKDGKLEKTDKGQELYPVAQQLLAIALSKNVKDSDKLKALDMIMDRVEGKATQKIEQTNEDVTPTRISFEEVTKPEDVRDKTPDN